MRIIASHFTFQNDFNRTLFVRNPSMMPAKGKIQFCIKQDIVCTVWTFQDLCVTHILREISFEDSRSAKTAVFAIFKGCEFC